MNVRYLVSSVSCRLLSMGALLLAASLQQPVRASSVDLSKFRRIEPQFWLPGVVLSANEHRLDRIAQTCLSFIGAPEPTAYRRDTACRELSSWYTKRATWARCGTVARGVLRPCRGRDPPRGGWLRGARLV